MFGRNRNDATSRTTSAQMTKNEALKSAGGAISTPWRRSGPLYMEVPTPNLLGVGLLICRPSQTEGEFLPDGQRLDAGLGWVAMETGAARGVALSTDRLDFKRLFVVAVVVFLSRFAAVHAWDRAIKARQVAVVDGHRYVTVGHLEVPRAVWAGHLFLAHQYAFRILQEYAY